MEQLVTTVRKSLLNGTTEDTKYRCIGAVEIQFRMHELGHSEDEMRSYGNENNSGIRNISEVRRKFS